MHLVQIPPDAVINGESPLQTMWPMIAPLLQRAVDYSDGMTTLGETLRDLLSKQKQLWVIVDDDKKINAALVSCLQKFESGLIAARITLIGGENLKAWFSLKDEFEKWAKVEGCTEVLFHVRKGWIRELPDYQLTQYVMRKKI